MMATASRSPRRGPSEQELVVALSVHRFGSNDRPRLHGGGPIIPIDLHDVVEETDDVIRDLMTRSGARRLPTATHKGRWSGRPDRTAVRPAPWGLP